MATVAANYDYLLGEDMRYDYLSTENRIKLINLIQSNLTDYDKGRQNKAKATFKEMNYKRKFTNDFLQLIANIIIENTDAGKTENDSIWIYANITSIFNIIAYRAQYESITRYAPLNNLYFLFLSNLYCNFKYYLNKKYYGISGTSIRGTSIRGTSIRGTSIRGTDFIHQMLFMFEQSGVTGMFYITEEQYAELFDNKDGKYDCDPLEGTIEKNGDMYQLSNSSLIQGAKTYIETNPSSTRMTIGPSRKRVSNTPYSRQTTHRGGRKYKKKTHTKKRHNKQIKRK